MQTFSRVVIAREKRFLSWARRYLRELLGQLFEPRALAVLLKAYRTVGDELRHDRVDASFAKHGVESVVVELGQLVNGSPRAWQLVPNGTICDALILGDYHQLSSHARQKPNSRGTSASNSAGGIEA